MISHIEAIFGERDSVIFYKDFFGIIINKTMITKEQLDEVVKNKKDWFLSAEEALQLGILTEIINGHRE